MSLAAMIIGVLSGLTLLSWGLIGFQIGYLGRSLGIGGFQALQLVCIFGPIAILIGAGVVMKNSKVGGLLMLGGGISILLVIGVNYFGSYLSAGSIIAGLLGIFDHYSRLEASSGSLKSSSWSLKPLEYKAGTDDAVEEPRRRYDRQRWDILKEVDSEIAAAALEVSALNKSYEDALAEKYIVLNDKTYLQALVKVIKSYHLNVLEKNESNKENNARNMTEQRKKILEERKARSLRTIKEIEENKMVRRENGKGVSSAKMYYGKSVDDHGYALIVYWDGTAELRSGEYFIKVGPSIT